MLLCHRDCAAPAPPIAEDHLLREATLLRRYVRRTARRWPRRWGNREQAALDLERALGSGLLEFLTSRSDGARTVSKTPSPANLHLGARLFAGADVVLLVRDGRSVVASLVEAWGWSDERATKEWRRGARQILGAIGDDESTAHGARFLQIRYEELVSDFDAIVRRLLEFTGLDPGRFDFERARQLPVLGSSYLRDGAGKLSWEPRSRTENFDPLSRFESWTAQQHDRFEWLAGDEQRALGYGSNASVRHVGRYARHVALDVWAPIRDAPDRFVRGTANWLRARRAELRPRDSN